MKKEIVLPFGTTQLSLKDAVEKIVDAKYPGCTGSEREMYIEIHTKDLIKFLEQDRKKS